MVKDRRFFTHIFAKDSESQKNIYAKIPHNQAENRVYSLGRSKKVKKVLDFL